MRMKKHARWFLPFAGAAGVLVVTDSRASAGLGDSKNSCEVEKQSIRLKASNEDLVRYDTELLGVLTGPIAH